MASALKACFTQFLSELLSCHRPSPFRSPGGRCLPSSSPTCRCSQPGELSNLSSEFWLYTMFSPSWTLLGLTPQRRPSRPRADNWWAAEGLQLRSVLTTRDQGHTAQFPACNESSFQRSSHHTQQRSSTTALVSCREAPQHGAGELVSPAPCVI